MPGSTYREWRPVAVPAALDAYWSQWTPAAGPEHVERVHPDGAADVMIGPDGAAVLVGPMTAAEAVALPAGTTFSGVRLRPGVVGPLLRVPAEEMQGRTVALDAVMSGPRARQWSAAALGDPAAQTAVHRELNDLAVDSRVTVAVELLVVGASLDAVTAAAGVSPRQLRRLLLQHAGLGPKLLQRILRLQRLLARMDGRSDLAGLAYELGYADQAHLTHEVRALAGVTPTALLRPARAPTAR